MKEINLTTSPPSILPTWLSLLKETWSLYRQNFKIFVGIVSIPVAFSLISSLIGSFNFQSIPGSLLSLFLSIDSFIVQVWFEAAIIYTLFEGKTIGVRGAYKKASFKLFSLFFINILVSAIILGGWLLFIIPGIIWSVNYSFVQFVLIGENKKGMEILKQSALYVKGYWWKVSLRYLAIGCIYFLFVLLAVIPTLIFVTSLQSLLQSETLSPQTLSNSTYISTLLVFYGLFWNILFYLLTPFSTIYAFLLYKYSKQSKKKLPSLLSLK